MIDKLRENASKVGEEELGFGSHEIGTHSIRSGGAMAMYLAKLNESQIQIIGRWKSNAFMRYIRKQVEQFTSGVTARMLSAENFTHIPTPSGTT